jgi:APA family basic amino acid/polyamine antiporter
MSGAFWSYDGWGNVAYIAGEVREPAKTIPRAILLGTACFILLYLLINAAYLYILPVEAIGKIAGDRVASGMASAVVGPRGAMLVAGLIMLSTFDTTNSSILTNARVYFAMARDRVFWRRAGEAHPVYRTPHGALWVQGVWAIVLLVSGSFDSITSMYVFVNWSLYALMAIGLFVLRRRDPQAKRPYETPGYPWVPGIFTLFSLCYVAVTLVTDVQAYRAGEQPLIKSLAGVALVLAGLPFYLYWRYSRSSTGARR